MEKVMNETFGLERAEISPETQQSSRRLGLQNPLLVPIRERGVSSEGDYLKCNLNVLKMVKKYGGQLLTGYQVSEKKIGMNTVPGFYLHVVWITPEGKPVCITKSNYEPFGGTHDTVETEKGHHLVFFPVAIYSTEEVEKIFEGTETFEWGVEMIICEGSKALVGIGSEDRILPLRRLYQLGWKKPDRYTMKDPRVVYALSKHSFLSEVA